MARALDDEAVAGRNSDMARERAACARGAEGLAQGGHQPRVSRRQHLPCAATSPASYAEMMLAFSFDPSFGSVKQG